MDDPNGTPDRLGHGLRLLIAILVGFVGCVIIWVWTPFNNFVMGGAYISDSYLPISALFFLLLLVLGVNPLLRKLQIGWYLDASQLAIVLGMVYMACVLPGQGLLRFLPYSLANTPLQAKVDKKVSDAFQRMDLPGKMFPNEPKFGGDPVASDRLMGELLPGESMPWGAWVGPLLTWGSFLFFMWLFMVGLSLIVFPQWRRNERLPFPLVTVGHALTEDPEKGRLLPPLFRKGSFWIAAGVVFFVHFLDSSKEYFPQSIPSIPISWNLSRLFTDEPFNYLPGYIKHARIYFVFLGVAFFMPNRIGFSLWFFQILYAGYFVIGNAYMPPFYYDTIYDHRNGAMIAVALGVLWLGRAHWLHVFKCMLRGGKEPEDARDRVAGFMFTLGALGMLGWLLWMKVDFWWAIFLIGLGFVAAIVVARIVAETGVPFVRIYWKFDALVKLAPLSSISPATLYFTMIVALFFAEGSRTSPAVMATHALGFDDRARPWRQVIIGFLMMLCLVSGLVICGASHLKGAYHNSMSLDGRIQPISPWGTGRFYRPNQHVANHISSLDNLKEKEEKGEPILENDRWYNYRFNRYKHLFFGFGLAAVLQWLCLTMPQWPLHPVGLLMTNTFYSNESWVSIMFGWAAKVILLRYGGARVYRAAQPVFLGLIVGEVIAAVFWALVPLTLLLLGQDYHVINIQPR